MSDVNALRSQYITENGMIELNVPSEQISTLFIWGNFADANVQPEISPNGTVWFPLGSPITADGYVVIPHMCFQAFRLNVTEATEPSSIHATVAIAGGGKAYTPRSLIR